MLIVAKVLVGVVAVIHLMIMRLEMFQLTSERGLKLLKVSKEDAEKIVPLGANQGLYNGFFAVALLVAIFYPVAAIGLQLAFLILLFILVAALFGGKMISKSILYVQGAPALIAFIIVVVNLLVS